MTMRVVVVGAGVVGASLAYHLAARGARVTLVDRHGPAAGVTARAFSWINVAHGVAAENAALRQRAIPEFHRLEQELGPALSVDWCGAMSWSADPAETERMVRDHRDRGYDIRLLDPAEIRLREPGLTAPPACAALAPGEGAVDPVAMTGALVDAARQAGAAVRRGAAVTGLAVADGSVTGVRIGDDAIDADTVVVAAGVECDALCAPLAVAVPISRSPAILLRFRTGGRLVRGIVAGPGFEVRQPSDDRMLAAETYHDGSVGTGPQAVARATLAAIRSGLDGGDGVDLDGVEVGIRPVPVDGMPILGFAPGVPGLYLSVMHAGIILAPVVGRLAAREILDGDRDGALDPCRPDRFGSG